MKSQLKAIQQYKRDGSNGYQQVSDVLNLSCFADSEMSLVAATLISASVVSLPSTSVSLAMHLLAVTALSDATLVLLLSFFFFINTFFFKRPLEAPRRFSNNFLSGVNGLKLDTLIEGLTGGD